MKMCKKESGTHFSHRYLINFGVFQMATATVATVTGAIPAGVSGTVRFFQNPFIANDNSRFTVEIVGLPVNTAYWVCLLPTNVVETPIIAANFLPDGTALQIPVVSISIPPFLRFPLFRPALTLLFSGPDIWYIARLPAVQQVHSEGLKHRIQHRSGIYQEGHQDCGRRHLRPCLRWNCYEYSSQLRCIQRPRSIICNVCLTLQNCRQHSCLNYVSYNNRKVILKS